MGTTYLNVKLLIILVSIVIQILSVREVSGTVKMA